MGKRDKDMKEGVQALFARKNNNPAPAPKQPVAKTRSEAEEKILDEKLARFYES